MLEVIPLGSGSQGNATLIRGTAGALLVDAGLPPHDLAARLRSVGHRPEDLDGIFLTHRHLDHRRAAGPFSRRFKIRVFATEKTLRHEKPRLLHEHTQIHPGLEVTVGGYRVRPIKVSHDAPQTVAFRIDAAGVRLGYVTDLGSTGGALHQVLTELDALLLEFNHDLRMLKSGPYSWPLKHRIAGARGHLSNEQAAQLLGRIATPRLRHLFLAHLSATNNTPELARSAAERALAKCGASPEIVVALQDRATGSWSTE